MEEGETLHIRFKKCMPFPALNLKLKLSPISERHMLYRRRTNGTLKCRQFGFSVCFKKKKIFYGPAGALTESVQTAQVSVFRRPFG